MKIELDDRETMFLNDLLNSSRDDIADEISETSEDPGADEDIILEMKQDWAICESIIAKLQKNLNG